MFVKFLDAFCNAVLTIIFLLAAGGSIWVLLMLAALGFTTNPFATVMGIILIPSFIYAFCKL
jgi:hypothetical protein